jgi:type II secretory pathway pseudopilin PulG
MRRIGFRLSAIGFRGRMLRVKPKAEGRKPKAAPRRAFTLIEALVSVSILAGLILMLAAIFRQSSQLAREARAGAAAYQTARQVFETLGRDLAGVTRDGFLFLRCEQLDLSSSNPRSGLILYYDATGKPVRINKGRFDMMAMATSGYYTSAADAARTANYARVIWGQTERASGNNLADIADTPKCWGTNLVLARHQTLMMPDGRSPDVANGGYGGSSRGPDYFNMGLSDLTRFFGPAMGIGGEKPQLPDVIENFGLFSSNGGEYKNELAPYRLSSKVFRLGRDGPGESGEAAGAEGGGDLTREQVNVEQSIDPNFFSGPSWNIQIDSAHLRDDVIRGQERPKIFGPKDYHRLAAFGVGCFQIDWTDGRRKTSTVNGEQVPGDLLFYPATSFGGTLNTALIGPGTKWMYCWNGLSPTSIRDTGMRKAFGGVTYTTIYQYWNGDYNPPANWREYSQYTQNMFGGQCSNGGGSLGRIGWPWPRALRVRMILYDSTSDPPVGYEFQQISHLLTQ